MALKKSQLYTSLWSSCDELRGGMEMQDRLSRLAAIFDKPDFRANRAEGDDLLGDAYEYLMRNFAAESGKSRGQFFTAAAGMQIPLPSAEEQHCIAQVLHLG